MKLAIIIGASRGLGAALCNELLKEGYKVAGFSRNKPEEHIEKNSDFHFFEMDASNIEVLTSVFSDALSTIKTDQATELLFVYNAGVLHPVGLLGSLEANSIDLHYKINLIAPTVLSNAFIHRFQTHQSTKRIALVTSGAAEHPLPGWTCYSSAKAGMNKLVEALSLEQSEETLPIRICAFNPGIMDTDMQADIRSLDKQNFPPLERFQAFHEKGALRPAEETAQALACCLTAESFPDGQITDVRAFL